MTIDEIYKAVQFFSNKEQRGFITPSEFNLLVKQAELELFNKRLNVLKEKSQPKKSAGFYSESLTPQIAEQDLAPFLKIESLNVFWSTSPNLGAYTDIKSSYIQAITILADDENALGLNVPVEIVKPENVNQILRSSLVKPSMEYPIALLSRASQGEYRVSIFPEDVKTINVYHYIDASALTPPKWDYVTVAGKPVYNATASRGPNFGSHVHGEIVIKILEYLGVHLREAEVVQYAQNKEVQQDN